MAATVDGFNRDGFSERRDYDDLTNMPVVLMELLATQGPIALYVDAWALMVYYGGIIPATACKGTQTNHGELSCILCLAGSEQSARTVGAATTCHFGSGC